MTILKARAVTSKGVVKDIPPTALSSSVWTTLENTKFTEKAIERAGVFRDTSVDLEGTLSNPVRGIQRTFRADLPDVLYLFDKGGFVWETDGQSISDVSVSGHSDNPLDSPVTHCALGGCTYFVRDSEIPVGKSPNDSTFVELFTDSPWEDSYWRLCRAYDNRLFVFNGGQGSDVYPRRVMWSAPPYDRQLATDWETGSLSSTAGWVDLPGANGRILDAQPLGNDLLIYSDNSVRRMYYLGTDSDFVYGNDGLFEDDGIIGTNLVGVIPQLGHFVVGRNSIYLTDGTSKANIAKDRVEKWFRQSMNEDFVHNFFVYVNYEDEEVWLCFVSTDSDATWPMGQQPYANRALVWSYRYDAWMMRDLPNISAIGDIRYYPDAVSWESMETEGTTWDTTGSTWAASAGLSSQFPVVCSEPYSPVPPDTSPTEWSTRKLMLHDAFAKGRSFLNVLRNPGYSLCERIGYIADELGGKVWDTNIIHMITLLGAATQSEPALVSTGGSPEPESGYVWSTYQEFDPTVEKWLNMRTAGRYLGLRVRTEGTNRMSFAGYDVDVSILAGR